jgi:hypothetical protein
LHTLLNAFPGIAQPINRWPYQSISISKEQQRSQILSITNTRWDCPRGSGSKFRERQPFLISADIYSLELLSSIATRGLDMASHSWAFEQISGIKAKGRSSLIV